MGRRTISKVSNLVPIRTAIGIKPGSIERAPGSDESRQRIAQVFRDNNEHLIRYLSARLSSREDAQEVAQEAYVRVLRLENPSCVENLEAFLFRTATNLAFDRLRQRKRRPKIEDITSHQGKIPSNEPLQDRYLSAREKLQLIRNYTEDLPPKCQTAFIMYKFEERTYTEIAQHMNLTESMVRKYVLRAVIYCKEQLDGSDL